MSIRIITETTLTRKSEKLWIAIHSKFKHTEYTLRDNGSIVVAGWEYREPLRRWDADDDLKATLLAMEIGAQLKWTTEQFTPDE